MSRSNTRSRRAQRKATPPELVPVRIDGREYRVPRRLLRAYQQGLLPAPEERPGRGDRGPGRSARQRHAPRTTCAHEL